MCKFPFHFAKEELSWSHREVIKLPKATYPAGVDGSHNNFKAGFPSNYSAMSLQKWCSTLPRAINHEAKVYIHACTTGFIIKCVCCLGISRTLWLNAKGSNYLGSNLTFPVGNVAWCASYFSFVCLHHLTHWVFMRKPICSTSFLTGLFWGNT